jgi:hypothetical protein
MATTEKTEQATPQLALAFKCPAHAEFFPDEDPIRPYTEFRVDPVTLERVHERSCRRCTAMRRGGLQRLTPLERVKAVKNKVRREIQRLEAQGQRGSEEYMAAHQHWNFLVQQEQDLRAEKEAD